MEVLRSSARPLAEFFTGLAEVSCGAPQDLRKGLAELHKGLAEVPCGGLAEFSEILRRCLAELRKTSARVLRRSCGGRAEVLRRSLRRSCGVY